jgi:hypothetical protein
MAICDFCSSENVVKRYPAADFTAPAPFSNHVLEQVSMGDWAACPTCASLIDRGQWNTLLNRSIDSFYSLNGHIIPRKALTDAITVLHQQFREHRKIA